LFAAAHAAAEDPKPLVEVTVTPQGQPWSVGRYGGRECEPTCVLRVVPDKYPVAIGGAKEEILIGGPTAITYSPGAPRLRTVSGWAAIGGVGTGGVLMGIGVWGLVQACASPAGCPQLTVSRTAAQVLVTTASVLISISVAGSILYAVSGESLSARDLPTSAPPPAVPRTFDVVLNPSSQGASLAFVKRF
jgi:hypothetical protein